MLREDMVTRIGKFLTSVPEEANIYHRADMLLSFIERLGMLPPHNQEGLTSYDIAMGSDTNKWSNASEE